MAQQQKKNAHVPKFGNWDNGGNVPYTVYFENARKGKVAAAGKMFNPNDPVDNPEAFSSIAAPSPSRAPPPPPSHHERAPSDAPPPPPPAPYAGGSPGGGRTSGGGGSYSVEHSPSPSPLHPYSDSGSGSYGGGLVANSRAKGGGGAPRGNETPTRGSAVPRFGDWDSNPASADGYTHIFNKVREEKQTGQAAGKPAAGLGKGGAAAGHGNAAKRYHGDDDYASTVSHSTNQPLHI
uniref:RIN4 pathogenic type III effector avirulence factor Avr cleavage site domain-containing protein n=1 Tax=Oryza meridionalis TaxID=40149 RepID=A0A0E0CEA4_9ORYZ